LRVVVHFLQRVVLSRSSIGTQRGRGVLTEIKPRTNGQIAITCLVMPKYVQDRLSGKVTTTDGQAVPGPETRWIGRRHGRRQHRRWATSWSPEQIANRLRIDFPMMSP
jgi:hypothetical protein